MLPEEVYRFNLTIYKKYMIGTIKTLTEKGYGFISRSGETKDLFFHSKDLVNVTFAELQVGTAVSFDVVEGDKGPSAKNVSLSK
jgi:cold shock protein